MPRLFVALLLLETLRPGNGKTTEWLIKTTHGDTDCSGATSAILEPLGICVEDSSSVFTKKSCEETHGQLEVTISYYHDSKCKKSSFKVKSTSYSVLCTGREKYECTSSSPVLSWPARADYPIEDTSCSGWSEQIKAFSANCTGNVTAKAECTDTELIYSKYSDPQCSAGSQTGISSVYRVNNCSLNSNGDKFYFASCEGVAALPGVTSNGHNGENDSISYSWWGILLTCLGVLCVVGGFLRIGMKNHRANAESGALLFDSDDEDEEIDYAPLQDVDALRGSFSGTPKSASPRPGLQHHGDQGGWGQSQNAHEGEDAQFQSNGTYLPMETSEFDLGDIDRVRGSFSAFS